jgi:glutathione synthase/RimK-type ligase-like ATP-grasp enzyme
VTTISKLDGFNSSLITVLTSRPWHATIRALVRDATEKGLMIHCGPRIDPASALVFQWSYACPAALTAVREFCAHRGIEHVNAETSSKWEQLVRFADAGLPAPNSRRAGTLDQAREAADLLGYPVVIKPNRRFKSVGVELVENKAALDNAWSTSHRVVQTYIPEAARCTRILVVGGRALSAVTCVTQDRFHATDDQGGRVSLEPYRLPPEREALALAACRALNVELAGVELVETANGPCILNVNHIRLELSDRELHGPDALSAVAMWLTERSIARLHSVRAPNRTPRLRIVTRIQTHPTVAKIREVCGEFGFAVEVGPTVDATVDATWFWELSARRHRDAITKLHALPSLLVNGHAPDLWADRARLFRAGTAVPRSLLVSQLDAAVKIAEDLGYPLTLRAEGSRRGIDVPNARSLRDAWPEAEARRCVLEPKQYAAAPRLRVWVAADRAFMVARLVRGRWRRVPLRQGPCDIAIAACRELQVDIGVVDLALVESGPVVLSVASRGRWVGGLSEIHARAALREIAGSLHLRLDGSRLPQRQPATPRLTVLMARDCDGPGGGFRIGNIQALYRELLRRGHRVTTLDGRIDEHLVAQADLILQDPMHAFGFGARADDLDRFLYENAAGRCHLLRCPCCGTADKRAMLALARELGVRAPVTYRLEDITLEHLPVVAKPRRGSLGIGVQLVKSMNQLRSLPRRSRMIVQQFIDSNTSSAVSLRAVTVVDRIVAAALFHNSGSICSNLARGGRAISLTGPGRGLPLTRYERTLLERIGIDPKDPGVPGEVTEMASTIGRYYAKNGVQMIGQDFVVDDMLHWYFIEVNMGFGTAIFNATDGEGFPHDGRGFIHAGRVLADAIEARFTRGVARDER